MAKIRVGQCECNVGSCCKGFTLTSDKEFTRDLVKYYANYGVRVTRKNDTTFFRFNIPCKHLDKKTFKCRIYGKGRPVICMQYPRTEDMNTLPKDCTFKFVNE